MSAEENKCEGCGTVCSPITPEERREIDTEAEIIFGELAPEDRAVLCDKCYREFMKWWESQGKPRKGV